MDTCLGSSDHRDKFWGLWQGAFTQRPTGVAVGARKLGKKSCSDGGEGPGGDSGSLEYPDTSLSRCAELPAPSQSRQPVGGSTAL